MGAGEITAEARTRANEVIGEVGRLGDRAWSRGISQAEEGGTERELRMVCCTETSANLDSNPLEVFKLLNFTIYGQHMHVYLAAVQRIGLYSSAIITRHRSLKCNNW